MDPRHLVLDLDGTISDPALGIARSINYALCAFGFDPIPESSVSEYIGPGIDNAFRRLVPAAAEDEVPRLVGKFRERYADVGYSENVLYPGIPEALRHLVNEGVMLGVCTTKRVDFAERILQLFGLRDCFQFVSGGDVGVEKHQQLRALIIEDVIPVRAAMIGDRAIDIVAAHANGLRSVGVLWGHGTEAELIEAEAQVLLSRPRQLMELAQG
ncbi:MAG TPA: HAD hydrolase-like protein [Woeseiaceae bacterium]|nr:HAD hydrolase-like protein [Woeseiaceae bacterium]